MRAVLLVVLLAACAGRGGDPAWPKQHDPEADGGESIAPRATTAVVAASTDGSDESDEIDEPDVPAAAVVEGTPATTPVVDKPATPTVTAPEEVIQIDDIVIEVED